MSASPDYQAEKEKSKINKHFILPTMDISASTSKQQRKLASVQQLDAHAHVCINRDYPYPSETATLTKCKVKVMTSNNENALLATCHLAPMLIYISLACIINKKLITDPPHSTEASMSIPCWINGTIPVHYSIFCFKK